MDAAGAQVTKIGDMKERAITYFTQLFTSHNKPRLVPDLNLPISLISNEESAVLSCAPTLNEIKLTLSNMPCDKAPGPDGLTVKILLHHWITIKEDVTAAMISYFLRKRMLKITNHTYIPDPNS